VDDFAFKKGHRYGTLLVDLERHQPVELLPDRTAGALATWLHAHPGVTVIARDRSGEYARGATLGAPAAQQVADRWHLLQNLRDAVERICNRLYRTLQQLPPLTLPTVSATNYATLPMIQALRLPSAREQALRADARDRRLVRYDQARRLLSAGVSQLQIANQLQMGRATVRRFAAASTFPERVPRARQARLLDGYEGYLEERWCAGCTNASQLWREVHARGYRGVRKQVARWAQQQRCIPTTRVYHDLHIARPRIETNTQIMQPTTNCHHHITCRISPHTDCFFQDTAAFNTADDVLNPHPTVRHKPIIGFMLI
jgi:transposase